MPVRTLREKNPSSSDFKRKNSSSAASQKWLLSMVKQISIQTNNIETGQKSEEQNGFQRKTAGRLSSASKVFYSG